MVALRQQGPDSPSFHGLVRQLQALHDQEVVCLRAEIAELRAAGGHRGVEAAPSKIAASTADVAAGDGGSEGGALAVRSGSFTPALSLSGTGPSRRGGGSPSRRRSAGAARLKSFVQQSDANETWREKWKRQCRRFMTGPGELLVGAAIVCNVMVAFAQQELSMSRGQTVGVLGC